MQLQTEIRLACESCQYIFWFDTHLDELSNERIQDVDGTTHQNARGVLFCADCLMHCQDCGELLEENERDDLLCESCMQEYFNCYSCNSRNRESEGVFNEVMHAFLCYDCHREQERRSRNHIQNYSYKPEPEFHSLKNENSKTFFGVELEVEAVTGNIREGAEIVKNSLGDFVYLKQDGSLSNGFEIVTHPFTLEWYKENFKTYFMRELSLNGFKSWDVRSCGIHVHVSRSAFKDSAHLWRFVNLFLKNKTEWVKMAGRNSTRWASYDPDKTPVLDILKKKKYPERYVAVNLSNESTVEIRIFRGSLNETRFRSAIESVAAAVEYTRMITLRDYARDAIKFSHFGKFVELYSDIYPNANQVMKKKGLN